ncbi:MAG: hypothetical protein Ct9H300mP30_3520 [Methanobacteriota archaeon]|nr:MAG: hypothetical protein Ct9H300mP30_3520 [Euryarchaeota archaeon]
MKSGPDTIAASIGELDYRRELDIYSARLSGADLVEAALSHNLDRELTEVMGFCQGRLKRIVSVFALRFSTATPRRYSVPSMEGPLSRAWPTRCCPTRTTSTWTGSKSPARARPCMTRPRRWAEHLGDPPFLISTPTRRCRSTRTRWTATTTRGISALRTSGQSHSLLLGYLRSEIDHRNIVNLLRALRQKLPQSSAQA